LESPRHWSPSSQQRVRMSSNRLSLVRGVFAQLVIGRPGFSHSLTIIDRQQYAAGSPPATQAHIRTPPSLSASLLRARRKSPRCACTQVLVRSRGSAGVGARVCRKRCIALHAASMMDGSRCGRGDCAVGDSQGSRRCGCGAARPRQEMPNFSAEKVGHHRAAQSPVVCVPWVGHGT
jgi:hypothetical protein